MKSIIQLSRSIFCMGVMLSIGALTAGRFLFVRMVLRNFRDSLINEIIIVDDKEFTSHDPYSIVYEAAFLGLSPDVQHPMMLDRLGRLLQSADRVVVVCSPARRDQRTLVLQSAGWHAELIPPEREESGV